eukprot:scaffold56667_cov18-Tisochrysis_lutea.AAC.1
MLAMLCTSWQVENTSERTQQWLKPWLCLWTMLPPSQTVPMLPMLCMSWQVENALEAHPAVAEAAVVPVDHAIKGQGMYAFITLMGHRPSRMAFASNFGDKLDTPPNADQSTQLFSVAC